MKIEIISAKKMIYEKIDVSCVTLKTTSGVISIYPDHKELISRIDHGEIEVDEEGKLMYFAANDGIMYISNDIVKILVGYAISAEEVDEELSLKAKLDAEKMLLEPSLEASEIAYLEAVISRENTKINISKLYKRR